MKKNKSEVTDELRKFFSENGSLGGRKAAANMTPKEKHQRARKAAISRWHPNKKTA